MLRRAFAIGAIVWAALLPAATYLIARGGSAALRACAAGVYLAGSVVCHQRPERSFHLWTTQMPVCARCAGIYAGGAIAALIALTLSLGGRRDGASGAATLRAVLLLSALPTAATLAFEWTTGVMPAGWVRALAGAPIGAAVVWLIARRRVINEVN